MKSNKGGCTCPQKLPKDSPDQGVEEGEAGEDDRHRRVCGQHLRSTPPIASNFPKHHASSGRFNADGVKAKSF